MKTQRYPQNRKYINYRNCVGEDRATATGNAQKFDEVFVVFEICERTHKQSHRQTHHNTSFPKSKSLWGFFHPRFTISPKPAPLSLHSQPHPSLSMQLTTSLFLRSSHPHLCRISSLRCGDIAIFRIFKIIRNSHSFTPGSQPTRSANLSVYINLARLHASYRPR